MIISHDTNSTNVGRSGVYRFGWVVLGVGILVAIVASGFPQVACTPPPYANCIGALNFAAEFLALGIIVMGLLVIAIAYKKRITARLQ